MPAVSILLPVLLVATAVPTPLPPAPETPFTETRNGKVIDDSYRWMEDPAQAEKLQAWMTAAGAATRARLDALPERAAFRAQLEAATRAGVSYSSVRSAGGQLFFLRRDPGAAVPKLVVRDAAGVDRVLVDPGATDGATRAIASFEPSPDGRLVAVMIGEGGGELGRFALLDVATGAERHRLAGTTFGDFELTWLAPDMVGYTRITHAPDSGRDPLLDTQAVVVTLTDEGPVERVALGSQLAGGPVFAPQEFPVLVAPAQGPLVLGLGVGARADMRVLVTTLASLRAGKPAWTSLAAYDDQWASVTLSGDWLYFISTKGASNGALFRRRLAAGGAGPVETVLAAGDLILSRVVATDDGIYVTGSRDGVSELRWLAGGTGTSRVVALPFESDLSDAAPDGDRRSLVFSLHGWTHVGRVYRATAGEIAPVGLDSADWAPTAAFTTHRDEAVSRDGTRVPMVVLRKPGTPGQPVPTIVEGYGSYGVLTTSPFSWPLLAPWVERGGAFVFCGTRGGGERGRAWHDGGREARKPNAHDDLAACAQRAQALGVSTPATTLVMGTSAGGLLAPPTALKHPALFTGLMPRVAVLNATRLEVAPNGPNQFAEMGDPRTPAGFDALRAQDAYLMLADADDMPDTLVTVGMNDSRVVPWMSAKFAACASAKFGTRREILLRVDTAQGHGIGSSRDSQADEFADAFAWAWQQATAP